MNHKHHIASNQFETEIEYFLNHIDFFVSTIHNLLLSMLRCIIITVMNTQHTRHCVKTTNLGKNFPLHKMQSQNFADVTYKAQQNGPVWSTKGSFLQFLLYAI